MHFFESALDDGAAAKRTVAATLTKTHECNECQSKRADESGVCPACRAILRAKIRVLNHVRSSACRAAVVYLPELQEETILMCKKADAVEIRAARRDGRSAPAARKSATSYDGKTHPGGIARL